MNLKVLVVGWDGATFDLLAPWIAAGELPNLARMMREGVHGPLRSVPNMNSGPAWTSVGTGVNPGKHGVYGLVGFADQSYRLRPLNAADRRVKAIWQRLSEAGKQMVVVNFPMTYPAEPINGVLVAGGDAPGAHSPHFTYPEGLIDELDAEVGEYILAARLDGLIRSGKKAEALQKLHRMIEGRTRATLYLMRRQPWDLCMVLFTASDSVQHFFWEDLAGGPHQDAILSVFRHLDNALGSLLAQAGDRAGVIVLSDHGFGPTQPSPRYVNDFLARLGLLAYKPRGSPRANPLRWLFLQLEKRLGDRTKEWLLERFPGLYERATAGLWIDGVDWSATRAFNLAGASEIWINVRGRQPLGIVLPGGEYEEVVTLIQRALGEAVDPTTGKPAVKAVHRRTDLYHGPYLDQAPDLFVEWMDDPVQSGLVWHGDGWPVIATHSIVHRRHPINGGHRKMGILVASGPPFKTGGVIEAASLYDIASTLLYLLGQPIPTSFDGRLLTGTLADDWLESHIPRFIDEERGSPSGSRIVISPEDEGKVMGRLRALGYVE